MTIALVSNVGIAGAVNGGTSAAINTTGATLLVMTAAMNVGSVQPTPTDSYSNTWSQIVSAVPGSAGYNVMFYVLNPTVGTGHTFTFAGTNIFSATQITAWSGVTTANTPLEPGYVGATGSGSTLQPGSITPNQNGSLIITSYSINGVGGSPTVGSGFTVSDLEVYGNSVNFGGGQAYLIQGTAAAINPTWTFAGSGTNASTIAAFGTTPTFTPIEKLSKLVGYAALQQTDERLTKFVGYSLMAQADERLTKLVSYAVLKATVQPAPLPMYRVIARNALAVEADDLEYSYNLQRSIQQKLHVGQPLTTNASVNLTGISATGSVGILGIPVNATITLTGVSTTTSLGSLIPGISFSLTGISATADVGIISTNSFTAINLTGISATGSLGSFAFHIDSNVPLTGVAAAPGLGILTPDILVHLTGIELTGSIGDVDAVEGPHLLGISSSVEIGSLLFSAGRSMFGVAGTAQIGDLTVSITPNMTNISLLGISATASVGLFGRDLTLHLTGIEAAGSVGSLTPLTFADGFTMTYLNSEILPTSPDRNVTLRVSTTAGASWQTPRTQTLGTIGQTYTSVQFRRLPQARTAVFELSWSGDQPTSLTGGFLEAIESAT